MRSQREVQLRRHDDSGSQLGGTATKPEPRLLHDDNHAQTRNANTQSDRSYPLGWLPAQRRQTGQSHTSVSKLNLDHFKGFWALCGYVFAVGLWALGSA